MTFERPPEWVDGALCLVGQRLAASESREAIHRPSFVTGDPERFISFAYGTPILA